MHLTEVPDDLDNLDGMSEHVRARVIHAMLLDRCSAAADDCDPPQGGRRASLSCPRCAVSLAHGGASPIQVAHPDSTRIASKSSHAT